MKWLSCCVRLLRMLMVVMKVPICLGKREECMKKHERGSQRVSDGNLHPFVVYFYCSFGSLSFFCLSFSSLSWICCSLCCIPYILSHPEPSSFPFSFLLFACPLSVFAPSPFISISLPFTLFHCCLSLSFFLFPFPFLSLHFSVSSSFPVPSLFCSTFISCPFPFFLHVPLVYISFSFFFAPSPLISILLIPFHIFLPFL